MSQALNSETTAAPAAPWAPLSFTARVPPHQHLTQSSSFDAWTDTLAVYLPSPYYEICFENATATEQQTQDAYAKACQVIWGSISEPLAWVLSGQARKSPQDIVQHICDAVQRHAVSGLITDYRAFESVFSAPSAGSFTEVQDWAGKVTLAWNKFVSRPDWSADNMAALAIISHNAQDFPEYLNSLAATNKLPALTSVIATIRTLAEQRSLQAQPRPAVAAVVNNNDKKLPPRPCRYCQKMHWHKECPVKDKNTTTPKPATAAAASAVGAAPAHVSMYTSVFSSLGRDFILVDSGATAHIVNDQATFVTLDMSRPETLEGIGGSAKVQGVGAAQLLSDNGAIVTLQDALYVPTSPINIISTSRAASHGLSTAFCAENGAVTIHSADNVIRVTGVLNNNGLYKLNATPLRQHASPGASSHVALAATSISTWHQRFAHLNFRSLQALGTSKVVHGLEFGKLSSDHLKCDACIASKITTSPFGHSEKREARPLALLHMDLLGFDGVTDLAGNKYLLVIVDDHSRYLWTIPLKSKANTFAAFRDWLKRIERSSNHKASVIRSDRGGEFMSGEFEELLRSTGLSRQLTIADTPQQNGVAERVNRSITEGVRSLLTASGLPHSLWGEAVATYSHVKNITPHRAIGGETPHKLFHGSIPDVSHLRVFGCRAWKRTTTEERSKLDPRGLAMIFVGYDAQSKAYRLFDAARQTVVLSRDVSFVESEMPMLLPMQEGMDALLHDEDDEDDSLDDDYVPIHATPVQDAPPPEMPAVHLDVPRNLDFDAPGDYWQPVSGRRSHRRLNAAAAFALFANAVVVWR